MGLEGVSESKISSDFYFSGATWSQRLEHHTAELSRSERDLVTYVNAHPADAVRLHQRDIAAAAGISKPIVISCYRKLGYASYREFQAGIEQFFATQIDSFRATQSVLERVDTIEELIREAVDVDIRSLNRLANAIDPAVLSVCADRLDTARSVYIAGPGTGAYAADYLSQRLRRYGIQSVYVDTDDRHRPDSFYPLTGEDIVILFHYADTDDWIWPLLSFARTRNAWTLMIAGRIHPDYVAHASQFIHVPRGEIRFKNSLAVPMHFANLMLLAFEVAYRDRARTHLAELESTRRVWDEASETKDQRQGGKHA